MTTTSDTVKNPEDAMRSHPGDPFYFDGLTAPPERAGTELPPRLTIRPAAGRTDGAA